MRFARFLTPFVFVVALCRIARADDDPPTIRAGTKAIGTFFDVTWSDDRQTFQSGIETGTKATTLGGDLTGGYLLTDHFALLLNVGVQRVDTRSFAADAKGDQIEPDTVETQYALSPEARYYLRIADTTFFFAQLRLSLIGGRVHQETYSVANGITTNVYDVKGFAATFSPGLTQFITGGLAAEATIGALGYSAITGDDGQGFKRTMKSAQFLIYASSINLGLVYYFGGEDRPKK